MFLHIFTTGKSTLNEPNMFLCHFLRKKDSKSRRKSRTKAKRQNSFPGLIRAYVRTDVRTYVTSKFSRLHGLPIIWLWMLRTHAPSARAGAPLLSEQTYIIYIYFFNNLYFNNKLHYINTSQYCYIHYTG